LPLELIGENLVDFQVNSYQIINKVPRIVFIGNYTDNFGIQWNKFLKTQINQVNGG